MAISQDPVCGNQQKSTAFWKRIASHYEEHRPGVLRPRRSLESKWGTIKHDVGKFIGVYQQILDLHPSGKSKADLIAMALELYRQKNPKNAEFQYLHVWEMVREYPRWADGGTTSRSSTPSRKPGLGSSEQVSGTGVTDSGGSWHGDVQPATHVLFPSRPVGTKAAKEALKEARITDRAALAQAQATANLASAALKKVAVLEDHNLLLLMNSSKVTSPAAEEYLRRRQEYELLKFERQMQEEERQHAATVAAQEEKRRDEAELHRVHIHDTDRVSLETERQLRMERERFPVFNDDVPGDYENLHVGGSDDNNIADVDGDDGVHAYPPGWQKIVIDCWNLGGGADAPLCLLHEAFMNYNDPN